MELNESSSNYSDMSCEYQKELLTVFAIVISMLIPFMMLMVGILNAILISNQRKGGGNLLEKTGTIVFNDREIELVGLLKVTYCTFFSMMVLYLILVVVILIVDKNCSLKIIPKQAFIPAFTLYGLLSYVFYYADQSIVSNIRSLRGTSQENPHVLAGMNFKSYIRLLLRENPRIVFNYIEWHHTGPDDEVRVLDVDIKKEFNYTRCDDVTSPTQLEYIEKKIDPRKPVILQTFIEVVCGDDLTKTKFRQAWYEFASIYTNNMPTDSKCVRQMDITSYKEEVMLFWDESQSISWWMSVKWYRIFALLLLAMPYKILFRFATQRVRLRLKKVIYCCNSHNHLQSDDMS